MRTFANGALWCCRWIFVLFLWQRCAGKCCDCPSNFHCTSTWTSNSKHQRPIDTQADIKRHQRRVHAALFVCVCVLVCKAITCECERADIGAGLIATVILWSSQADVYGCRNCNSALYTSAPATGWPKQCVVMAALNRYNALYASHSWAGAVNAAFESIQQCWVIGEIWIMRP